MPIDLQTMKDEITIIAGGGLGNRLFPIASALLTAQKLKLRLNVHWCMGYGMYTLLNKKFYYPESEYIIHGTGITEKWDDLFDPIDVNWVVLDDQTVKSAQYTTTIDRPGLYNHWHLYNAKQFSQYELLDFIEDNICLLHLSSQYPRTVLHRRKLHPNCWNAKPPVRLEWDYEVNDDDIFNWRKSVQDLDLMSKAQVLIRPEVSTFSQFAWYLGGCSAKLVNY